VIFQRTGREQYSRTVRLQTVLVRVETMLSHSERWRYGAALMSGNRVCKQHEDPRMQIGMDTEYISGRGNNFFQRVKRSDDVVSDRCTTVQLFLSLTPFGASQSSFKFIDGISIASF